ncbi:MAG TPA: hypothetical protein VHT52_25345 [Stellaceae bacterium]|nr:hypothetical protein [Stellaceae bacterium]
MRRLSFRSEGRRRRDQELRRLRLDQRGSGRTRSLHRQYCGQGGGQNRDDDKAWQVDPQVR